MRIGIIGAGAVGMLIASRLNEKNDVVLFTRTAEQADCINENGINYTYGEITQNLRVKSREVHQAESNLASCDAVFVTVKSYSLDDLASVLKTINKPIVFTQNGMSHVVFANELTNDEIYFGVVEHGVRRLSANEIVRSGSGRIVIGTTSAQRKINFSEITTEDFPIIETDDILEAIESKLVVNTLVNPLTAVNKVTNGELVSNEILHSEMLEIFDEVKQILELENDELLQKTIEICNKTKENRSSMLQDFENGGETEIDSILGVILKKAAEKGVKAPKCEVLFSRIKDQY